MEAPFQKVIYLNIRAGYEDEFSHFLTSFLKAMQEVSPKQSFSWYRIEDGHEVPQYFLMLPHQNFAEFRNTENLFERILKTDVAARKKFRRSVKKTYTETMGYRADLTFLPRFK